MNPLIPLPDQLIRYRSINGIVEGKQPTERWLSQLPNVFIDLAAYENTVQAGDRLIYYVTNVEPATGEGNLHYGLGVVLPGKIGEEYYLTRGHLHAMREAAEVYICLRGQGMMLLEDERTGECRAIEMTADSVVYVPGYTAHRTVNVGNEPLVYWGVYPYNAGHDYQTIQQRNFNQVVICREEKPLVINRSDYLKTLAKRAE